MPVNELIAGSIARFNHAQRTFEKLADIWIEQSNKISFKSVYDTPSMAHIPELPADNIDMPLLAGDVFHSLRCSLEYLYRALYIHKIGHTDKRIQFPSKRDDYKKSPLKNEMNILFDRYEDTITTLAAANNQDKHRLLLFAMPKLEPIAFEKIDGQLQVVSNTNPSDWHDARVPRAYDLGAGIRTRYVLIIEKDIKCAEIILTLKDFSALNADLLLCLKDIQKMINLGNE